MTERTNRTHYGHNQRQILNFCLTGCIDASGYPVTGPDSNQIIRYDLNGLCLDHCDPTKERKCGSVPSLLGKLRRPWGSDNHYR